MTAALPLDTPPPVVAPLERLRTATRRLRTTTGHLRDVSARVHTSRLDDLPFPAAVLSRAGVVEAVNTLFAAAHPNAAPGTLCVAGIGPHDRDAFARALARAATRRTIVTVLVGGVARVWTLTASHDGRIAVSA